MAASNRPPNPNPHLLNPNPTNSFPPASSQRSTPTLFAARPLNPNPNHTIPHGILYPVSARPHPTVAALPTVAGVNPTVYARSISPATGHVTSHMPQLQQQPHRYVYAGSDVPHHLRQALLPSFAVPRTVGPSAPPLKGVPISSHAKVLSFSSESVLFYISRCASKMCS